MSHGFAEIIFTRCRNGIDLRAQGRPQIKDGFQVYSCTPSLFEDDTLDLPLVESVVTAKQPFADPALMDDAYLYLVPETGPACMVDFYPVPRDPDTTGNYDHRLGNYLTHTLVGNFSAFYPFELFRDPAVWTARTRGQGYYYLTPTAPLPLRQDISNDPPSQIYADDLAAFAADGRRDALKAAVAFLIAQYEQPPENRKFLVIKDASEELLELWIAAIEYAFSPRIAASVPFATRLTNISSANLYFVDARGRFQATPAQGSRQRLRAMIVGVDERDQTNSAAARPLPNGAFVLLDGKAKRAMFEADTSDPYYDLVTRFDDTHTDFTRDFLQMVDLRTPSPDLHQLAQAYFTFSRPASLDNVGAVFNATNVLSKYSLVVTGRLKALRDQLATRVPSYLQQSVPHALQIMDWLSRVAVNDDPALPQRLAAMVSARLESQIYEQDDPAAALGLWDVIKSTSFAASVAKEAVNPIIINRNRRNRPLSAEMTTAFTQVYLDAATLAGSVAGADIATIAREGLQTAFATNDGAATRAIIAALSRIPSVDLQDVLLQTADGGNPEYDRHIIGLLAAQDPSIAAPGASLTPVIEKLQAAERGHLVAVFLQSRADALRTPAEVEQFVASAKQALAGSEPDLVAAFQAADQKLSLLDKQSVPAAIAIQQERPAAAICPVSAHIYALDALGDRRARGSLFDILSALAIQRFPSIDSPDYAQALVDRLGGAQFDSDQWTQVITWFSRTSTYANELATFIVKTTGPRQTDLWNLLMEVAVKQTNRLTLFTAIVDACVNQKLSEKALTQLGDLLGSKAAKAHFQSIADGVTKQLRDRPQGIFGRLRHQ